ILHFMIQCLNLIETSVLLRILYVVYRASHETAKEALGDKELRAIAHELTKTVKDNMSVDWSKRDSAKAKMRVQVRRLLKKYGYPPDLQKMAVEQVVEQAELMASQQ
ncbi:type I restriction enzyme endonuclease domain-containing protein, partial [Staphylococcus epidermidis]